MQPMPASAIKNRSGSPKRNTALMMLTVPTTYNHRTKLFMIYMLWRLVRNES